MEGFWKFAGSFLEAFRKFAGSILEAFQKLSGSILLEGFWKASGGFLEALRKLAGSCPLPGALLLFSLCAHTNAGWSATEKTKPGRALTTKIPISFLAGGNIFATPKPLTEF